MDSAQLVDLAPIGARGWLDIGSGAGLPGIVIALLSNAAVTLCEPRALRVAFLRKAIAVLSLQDQVAIAPMKVERLLTSRPFGVVTARAVAPLPVLLRAAHRLTAPDTVWLLPKGRSAADELEQARQSWHGEFRLHPSATDPAAAIVIARNVRPRKR